MLDANETNQPARILHFSNWPLVQLAKLFVKSNKIIEYFVDHSELGSEANLKLPGHISHVVPV